MKRKFTLLLAFALTSVFNLWSQEARTITGTGNNLTQPEWGAAGTAQLLTGTTSYSDGVSEPAGLDRPNPRVVSNVMFSQTQQTNDPRGMSAFTWAWGQFIDHDITLVPDNVNESYNVSVPSFDFFFDPNGTGAMNIPMFRSAHDPNTGTGPDNPRAPINKITAFIDASGIYSSNPNDASWLRMYSKGKLKLSDGKLLPYNTVTGEYDAPLDAYAPSMAMPFPFISKWFISGDARANENPCLTSLHTLFTREHNRICTELFGEHPDWSDETLYQEARRRVGAEIQAITYEEWLPQMGLQLPAYQGYQPETNPQIMNVFSGAAFRYGHTTINNMLQRMNNEGHHMPEGDIMLRDAYFNPQATKEVNGIEPYLIGMTITTQQDLDCKVIDDLRNFLFGAPGAGGLDLVSLNIQRGRERGLPDYNTLRTDFGLAPVGTLMEVNSDMLMFFTLQGLYGTPENLDPWVGMLAEDHLPGSQFGATATAVISRQFQALRDGDRFYYENDPAISSTEKANLKSTRLADVIRRNTYITCIHDDVFHAQPLLVTGVAEASQAAFDLEIYPNPATDHLTLQFESAKSQDIPLRVLDMLGRTVLQQTLEVHAGSNQIRLALPATAAPGTYRLLLNNDGQPVQAAFIKA
ncbi:MAG: T9SS type A sorting domain-containing protein [Lewinellaceae bacterium]|nr:T9SS type A sorting domain-containing protein [Lewinellaceae bacterium]